MKLFFYRHFILIAITLTAAILTSCSQCTDKPPTEAGTIAVKDIQTGETRWVDPNELQQGPIQRDSLTAEQMKRIKDLQKIFVEIDGLSVDQWVDGFKRDLNPDSEIAIWERMAKAYTYYCDGRKLSLDARKDVYKVVLLRSMASEKEVLERVQLTVISKEAAMEIMANF